MVLPRSRGYSSVFRSQPCRTVRVRAAGQTWRQIGRRSYASGHHEGGKKASSDLPWLIGSVAVTVPSATWLWQQGPTKSDHHDHHHHGENEEHKEHDENEKEKEESDDKPEDNEESKPEDTEESGQEDGKQEDNEEESKPEEDQRPRGEKIRNEPPNEITSTDNKSTSSDEGLKEGPNDALHKKSQQMKSVDPDADEGKKPGPSQDIDKGHEGEEKGTRVTEEDKKRKAQDPRTNSMHPYMADERKSKKAEGVVETAKITADWVNNSMARPRRRSSNLGADPRGDTSAPAISTLTPTTPSPSSPSFSEKSYKPHSKRRKARSALRRWKQISLRHTWLNPLIIVLVILCGYAVNPSEANPLRKAIFLSYPNPAKEKDGPVMYGKGRYDIAFVAFYTIVLSFTREFLMQRVIRPWAIRCGIRGRAKQSRFMEQAYTAMYFGIFGPFGMYIMSQGSLWYFNTTAMFEGYPHKQHEGVFKAYYLLQASYWSQQAIVLLLQLEKPRKDFKELVLHHIVTLSLIALSYRFHFAKMGIAVYITHDISDFFLATSKTLNYLDSPIVGPYFGFFILVWIYLRHYINLTILYATLTEFRTIGPFELNWERQQYKCPLSQYITFGLLASLQAVNLFWLFLILRIAKNYVITAVAMDERSDNEEEEEGDVDGKDEVVAVEDVDSKEKAKRLIENKTGMETDKLAVQLNGKPISRDSEAHPEGVVERRRKR